MSNTLINAGTRRTLGLTYKLICDSSVRNKIVNVEKKKLCAVLNCNFWIGQNNVYTNRKFSVDTVREGSAARAETTSTIQGLSKLQAQELVLRLTDEERNALISALHEYHSKIVKEEYEGQLAASRWRSKFGRPSKLPTLGDVDPTGSYCPLPEDWLERKRDTVCETNNTNEIDSGASELLEIELEQVQLENNIAGSIEAEVPIVKAQSVPRPTTRSLIDIAIANSIPFIGFGFLDNFFMLIFGDYIDVYLGSYFILTTMAAAAIGNTFSDILGIGTAFYVERLANKVGFRPPKLSPMQMDLSVSRNFANLGRVLGVTLGCILGMVPLLFFRRTEKDETKDKLEIVNSRSAEA